MNIAGAFSLLFLYCFTVTTIVDGFDIDFILPQQNLTGEMKKARSEKWIEQRLNNFDPLDRRTWNQRYYVSDAYYEPGAPAFLMLGGESPTHGIFLNSTSLIMNAVREFNGVLFLLEHRYYGKSRPTNDTSVDNLRYLTSQQALEDIAVFIRNQTKSFKGKLDKWIVHGGSYSGTLAVWMKLKYPHLVHAVVAASPPLVVKVNFVEYLQSVNKSLYAYGGPKCYRNTEAAYVRIKELLKSEIGMKEIFQMFNVCNDTSLTGKWIHYFYSILNGVVEHVVQYSLHNTLFGKPYKKLYSINDFCKIITNESIGTELERFVSFFKRDDIDDNCHFDFGYEAAENRNVSWGNESTSRAWSYQTCTELGFFQTKTSDNTFFFPVSPLFPVDLCNDEFGGGFNLKDMRTSIERTNFIYGGKSIYQYLSRTVIFNGGIDPWHMLSHSEPNIKMSKKLASGEEDVVRDNLNFDPQGFTSIFVPSSSHCDVMYPEFKKDSYELKAARNVIKSIIGAWL